MTVHIKLPKIDLAQGDVAANTRAARRWFKVIAWALENHPKGLFLGDLRHEYQRLCALQGASQPYTDDGDFQGSLSRQLQICLSICQQMGWVTYRLEKPIRTVAARPSGGVRPMSAIPEHKWSLTNAGNRANNWPQHRLARSIALHLLRVGVTPWVGKLRLPLGLLSAAIGLAKLVANWGGRPVHDRGGRRDRGRPLVGADPPRPRGGLDLAGSGRIQALTLTTAMDTTITPDVTYWYRSKLAQAAAEWGEVERDLRHSRNCFTALVDLVGRENLERALEMPATLSDRAAIDVDDPRYTTIRALCDSALVSYERAFEGDTNGRRAFLDRDQVSADAELKEIHEALRIARNKIIVHPASGLEGSDCEVEVRRDGALRIDFRTRNSPLPLDVRVLMAAADHVSIVIASHLRALIDEAALAVENEFIGRSRLVVGSTSMVRFRGDQDHALIEAHDQHRMINPFANPKRRNADSRNYPPAFQGDQSG